MPTAEEIQQVYNRYMAALVRHDLDGVMVMFAPNAVLHDPVDGPERQGLEAIREFFAGGINGMRACRLACPLHISADGRHAAASAYSEVEVGEGISIFETTDVLTFDDDGKVSTMTAYYGPTNIRPA